MDKKIINPPTLAPPRGYNHGILVKGGQLLFLAGQDAGDAAGQIVGPGDLVAQFEQVLRNLKVVVEAAGGTMHNIVQLTIYVQDRDDYVARLKPLGRLFRAYFGGYYPAISLVEISRLFREEALVELEGLAVIE
jgi:enamine deaminase RidA (YjgF/YER057c/UK114 family)